MTSDGVRKTHPATCLGMVIRGLRSFSPWLHDWLIQIAGCGGPPLLPSAFHTRPFRAPRARDPVRHYPQRACSVGPDGVRPRGAVRHGGRGPRCAGATASAASERGVTA